MSTTMEKIPGPARDVVGYNGKPPKVTWPNNARIAILLVVNYEEGSEQSVGDGRSHVRAVPERSRCMPAPMACI